MRLAGGGEIGLDADVELLRADPEPDPAAGAERLRLLDLLEPEQLAEEAAGGVLAAGGGGELDVVDAVDHACEATEDRLRLGLLPMVNGAATVFVIAWLHGERNGREVSADYRPAA